MGSQEQESYNDFMKSTGFGSTSGLPRQPGPKPGPNASSISNAPHNFARANTATPMLSVPGTEYDGPDTPGHMKPSAALMKRQYKTPYPESNVIQDKSAFRNQGPTEQKEWDAVGLGPKARDGILRKPASVFRRGGQAREQGVLSLPKEYQGGTPDYDRTKLIAGIFGGFFLLASLGLGGKWATCDANNKYLYAVIVSLAATGVTIGIYYDADKKSSSSEKQLGFGRKALMKDNLPRGYDPIQRDQPDPKVYQNSDDPNDQYGTRLRAQGTDTNTMEGPRRRLGYRRSPPAPDGRPVLKANELMRDPGTHNMDAGTFEEYMRRLDGEAPNQFYQAQPYYTFNANWENRGQINDGETVHGIGTAPGQMMRKAIYKDPKIQMAGAKTMHLKDPPPGAQHYLDKTHPWMETDESGQEPPMLMATPANQKGLSSEHAVGNDLRGMIDERSRQQNAMIDAKPPTETEMSKFLQPEETMSERKRSILSGGNAALLERENFGANGSPPDAPIDVNSRGPPQEPVPMRAPNQTGETPRKESGIHGGINDQGFDEHVTPPGNSFDSMFEDKASATKEEIEEAQLDTRR